jgi:hypothetical protein
VSRLGPAIHVLWRGHQCLNANASLNKLGQVGNDALARTASVTMHHHRATRHGGVIPRKPRLVRLRNGNAKNSDMRHHDFGIGHGDLVHYVRAEDWGKACERRRREDVGVAGIALAGVAGEIDGGT